MNKSPIPHWLLWCCFQLRLLTSFVFWPAVWAAGGWDGAMLAPATIMATSPVDHIMPNIYSGYKTSLHYLLSRIIEQQLRQGRNLGGILEKGEKSWTNLPIAQFLCVLGYLSRSSWNKEKAVTMTLWRMLIIPFRYGTGHQPRGRMLVLSASGWGLM